MPSATASVSRRDGPSISPVRCASTHTLGPAGLAIPIGLPLLAVIGSLLWKDAAGTGTADECDDDLSDEDDAAPRLEPAGAVPGGDDS